VRLIIRADSSNSIGAGHVMRTSVIASEFLKRGNTVVYVGNIEPSNLITQRFKEIGVSNVVRGPVSIGSTSSDILLIDSYTLPITDPFLAKENWHLIVAIVDGVTPNFICDLAIHPSLIAKQICTINSRFLSGPNYILLRDSIRKIEFKNHEAPLRILLAAGGSDPSHFCNAIIKTLSKTRLNFKLEVFSSNLSPDEVLDSRISVHSVGLEFDEIANHCDLAFTLASSLSLELIARGMPTGVGVAYENQQEGFEELVSNGFAAPLGYFSNQGEWNNSEGILIKLITSYEYRRNLHERVASLIDFEGAKRIVSEILG